MIDGLLGVKDVHGLVQFLCQECKIPVNKGKGAQNSSQSTHLLVCPSCGKTLGEWLTEAMRNAELRALAKKVRQGI